MKITLPRPYWRTTSALACAGMMVSSFAPLSSEPTHPVWWGVHSLVDGTTQNKGAANLGQLKNMATAAHAELEALLPGGAGFDLPFDPPPPAPDATWYKNQKKALNLGQLKAIAEPFYGRLNGISPAWVEAQFQLNGLTTPNVDYFEDANGYFYPWNPNTPVAENYKAANVGQLKAVFALRFREDVDGDFMNDLFEYMIINDNASDGIQALADVLPGDDYDGDEVNNLAEYQAKTDPTNLYSGGTISWPSDAIVGWYRTDPSNLTVGTGNLVSSWINTAGTGHVMTQANVNRQPESVQGVLNTQDVVRFEGNDTTTIASDGVDMLTPQTDGFSVLGIFTMGPSTGTTVASMLSNESYQNSGFRFGVYSGLFRWWSNESGGTLSASQMYMAQPVQNGQTYQFALQYEGSGAEDQTQMHVDGALVKSLTGKNIAANTNDLKLHSIGGWPTQPGDWGELIVTQRSLSRGELTMVQDYLRGKFQNAGPLAGDTDGDGIPDWREVEIEALGSLDADGDGLTNAEEAALGTDPNVADNPAVGLTVEIIIQ